jgi:hypothetical protein
MKQFTLKSQLIVIVACGVAIFTAGFFAPGAEIVGVFRLLLLIALLLLLSASAIRARMKRRDGSSAGMTDGRQPVEEGDYPRLLTLLAHPVALGLLFGAVVAVHAFTFRVMSCDEGMWNYVAHAWVKFGLLPYVDTVENKTPGIFYLFAAGNLLFDVNYWFPRVAGIVVMVLTGLGIYAIGARLQGRTVGLLAMLFYAMTSVSRVMDAPLTSQTETFMLGCSVLAAYGIVVLREARSLRAHLLAIMLAGVSLGAAIAFKQIAIITALGLLFFYLSLEKPHARTAASVARDCLVALGGIVVATGISLIPLLLSGVSVADYVEGAWLLLLAPGSATASAQYRVLMALRVMESTDLQLYLPLLLLVLLMSRRMLAARVPLFGLLGWYACDLIAVNASGAYYGHQLRQALPPLALLSAVALWTLLRAQWAPEPLLRTHRALVIGAVALIWWTLPGAFITNLRADAITQTAAWLRNHTTAREYVYTFGTLDINPILAGSERRASSRYFNQVFFDVPGAEETIKRELAERPPAYIVIQRHRQVGLLGMKEMPGWVDALLARSYHLEKEMLYTGADMFDSQRSGGYLIYRRNQEILPADRSRPADNSAG